jgi:hypothetical protein
MDFGPYTIGFIVDDQTDDVEDQLHGLECVCQIEGIKHVQMACIKDGCETMKLMLFDIDRDAVIDLLGRVNRTHRVKAVLETTI